MTLDYGARVFDVFEDGTLRDQESGKIHLAPPKPRHNEDRKAPKKYRQVMETFAARKLKMEAAMCTEDLLISPPLEGVIIRPD